MHSKRVHLTMEGLKKDIYHVPVLEFEPAKIHHSYPQPFWKFDISTTTATTTKKIKAIIMKGGLKLNYDQ